MLGPHPEQQPSPLQPVPSMPLQYSPVLHSLLLAHLHQLAHCSRHHQMSCGARSTSANFDFGQPFFSTSANFDFGQFLDVGFWDDKMLGPKGWRSRRVEPQT